MDFLINQLLVKTMFLGVPLILLGGYLRLWLGARGRARVVTFAIALIILAVEAWLTLPSPDFQPLHLALTAALVFSTAYFSVPKEKPIFSGYCGGPPG